MTNINAIFALMKIEHLSLFTDVMREGSFTAVAQLRGIDPSSVSRAIATLEAELGLRLFERTTRRFEPTEAGRIYFLNVHAIIGDMELAAARARDVSIEPAGTLRVTSSVAFGCEVLSPLVAGLRERYPALKLELMLSDIALDLVGERLDLAIRLGPPPEGDLVRTRLFPVQHRVVASRAWVDIHGLPLQPEELANYDCVRFPFRGFRDCWRYRVADGSITEVSVQGTLMVSNALALKRCITDGLGPALMADWMIQRELDSGELVDLLPDYEVTATVFETAAWLLYPSRAYVPTKLRVFIDYLIECLALR